MNFQEISEILIVAMLIGMVSAPASLADSNSEQTMIKSDGRNICSVSVKDYSSKSYEEKIYQVKFCSDPAKYPPVGIHVFKRKGIEPKEFDVLLPGTGLNSTMNFFENEKTSMAEFLADKGILVVGVDYPETNIKFDPTANYSYLATMGLSRHTDDVEKIVNLVQEETDISKYSVVGHSLGGLIGLDFASKHSSDSNLLGLYVIDMAGTLNASQEPQLVQSQRDNYNATAALISDGETVNFEMLGLAILAVNAKTDPGGDSGVPIPSGINWTNYQYLLIASIYTGLMPGNEIFVQGFFAGDLSNGLYLTPIETVYSIASQGKIYPLKINEDIFGIYAGVPGSYQIKWKNIKVPVKWENFELGIGSRGEEAANLIKQGGNQNVRFWVVHDYEHADGVYSLTAERDVWNPLFAH
jgi:pimeloyl-ACP methyl ester carboxylesterase